MVYIRKFLQRFYKKQDGAVAIIVAVALVAILFGVLSLSIDLNRTQTSYTHNYNATDASALAAAEMWLQAKIDSIGKIDDPLDFRPTPDEMNEYAKKVLLENFAQDQKSSVFLDNSTFKVVTNETRQANGKIRYSVTVDACAQLGTPIANVPDHVQDDKNPGVAKTCTSSTAGFDLGKLENAEVAFALDFTESMYWQGANQGCPPGTPTAGCLSFEQTKAYALQQAMDYVFTKYFDASKEATAFASIVPFTSFVNVYPFADNGVVRQGSGEVVNYSGQSFVDAVGVPSAWDIYRPVPLVKTVGKDLKSYGKDADYSFGYIPFYTSRGNTHDENYRTDNYTNILNRIPTIDSYDKLQQVINNPDNTNFLPFTNYFDSVNDIATKNFVTDKTKSEITKYSSNPNEQYAKMVCYQFTVAGAADERVDGALFSSKYGKTHQSKASNKDVELHESFPIQPLTNDSDVLNNVLKRYVADSRLTSTYTGTDVIDLQTRIDKARIISSYHKTSGIHGLMWAWFTINNAWKDIWDKENSLHETYVGGDKSSRDGSTGEQLPSEKNFKHIIFITDGFDNDGCEDVSGATTSTTVNKPLGRLGVCDAYTPVESVNDEQYNDLCTAIKTNGTSDFKDDISIHMVTLDFDAGITSATCPDPKTSGENNRYAKCATPGEYYNNVTPDELKKMFDDIFAGILTKAVPVRLIK